jgi:hypothetical protein
MNKISKNVAIWASIALAVTLITAFFVIELEDKLGEFSGLLIIVVAIYAALLALIASVIQGIFIKMHYFQMGAIASICMVGTLILIIMQIPHLAFESFSEFDFWFMVKLLSIPCYGITAISYFSTRDK